MRPQSDTEAGRHDFADAPERVPLLLYGIDPLDHTRFRLRVQRPQGRPVRDHIDVVRIAFRWSRANLPELHDVTSNANAELRQKATTYRADGDARRRLARGCALEDV